MKPNKTPMIFRIGAFFVGIMVLIEIAGILVSRFILRALGMRRCE